MILPDELYNIYLEDNQKLYPQNIFDVDSIEQLKSRLITGSKTLLFYKGVFDSKVMSVLGRYILQVIDSGTFVSEKLFKIYMELAQNISFYSGEKSNAETKEGIGIISIHFENNRYYLQTGNIIRNSDVEEIEKKLKLINTLDHLGLRELKRQQRHRERGDKGTANVGLIQVAIISENSLSFYFNRINDEFSFYSLVATVNAVS